MLPFDVSHIMVMPPVMATRANATMIEPDIGYITNVLAGDTDIHNPGHQQRHAQLTHDIDKYDERNKIYKFLILAHIGR